jgi:hypothetical protein
MTEFTVLWEVDYYDSEKVYFVNELNDAESLDALLDDLGENAVDHEPENETPTGLGDFNIEYIIITDNSSGKEVWRDSYYNFKHKAYLNYESGNADSTGDYNG